MEQGPLVDPSSSLSLNMPSKKLGGASSNTGSGGFSSTTSVKTTVPFAPLAFFYVAAASAAFAASFLAISSAVGGGGLISISYLVLRDASIVSTTIFESLSFKFNQNCVFPIGL